MKELSIEEKAQAYDEALKVANKYKDTHIMFPSIKDEMFPKLKEGEDEMIRKVIIEHFEGSHSCIYPYKGFTKEQILAWLKKQGKQIEFIDGFANEFERQVSHLIISSINKEYEYTVDYVKWVSDALLNYAKHEIEKQSEQKEINLVEILKHYPRETELYSPLYGKLWLAEVDEENAIITCYKYPLDEGCTRAILEQEDTVSFYSNGTTGLPDFSVSKDCMLFLYDIEKQGEQDINIQINPSEYINNMGGNRCYLKNTIWKPTDEEMKIILETEYEKGRADAIAEFQKEWSEDDEDYYDAIIAKLEVTQDDASLTDNQMEFLKSLKDKIQPHPKQEWNEDDEQYLLVCKNALAKYQITDKWDAAIISHWLENRLKSSKERVQSKPKQDWSEKDEEMIKYFYELLNHAFKSWSKFEGKAISALDWIESLKERVSKFDDGYKVGFSAAKFNQWKPSDRELGAILTAIGDERQKGSDVAKELLNIYQQLKKLREELWK